MKITYFGSAFNPPHIGHRNAIEWLSKRYGRVIVSPSAAHAFGKQLPPMDVRLAWLSALLEGIAASNVVVSDVESALQVPGKPVYSYQVLRHLRDQYPDCQIDLAVGPDNADPSVWQRFYKWREIEQEFGRVVIPDMGPFRSTLVRALLTDSAPVEKLQTYVGSTLATLLAAEWNKGEAQ